jgi:Trypsin-like peptidase domain
MMIEPTFKQTSMAQPITEFALALAARKGDVWVPSGTAIVIAPHLALSAGHVIEDFWRRFERSQLVADVDATSNNRPVNPGTFSMMAFQILEKGTTGQIWSVTKAVFSRFTDVAFLHLTHPIGAVPGFVWRGVKIGLAPPSIGSRIVGFGYYDPKITVTEREGERLEVEWHDSPVTTVGEVLEIYSQKRDSAMLTFPCYRTSARFEHGMSGGPVFNDQGELCGLICSGGETEADYYSHVVTLWPSMATVLDLDREGFPKGQSYPAPVADLSRLRTGRGW